MSEFKFACPVCGQHITADSAHAGSRLECPTCYRKIVVPQAPSSAETKFILAAAQADRPRPPGASAPERQRDTSPPARTGLLVALSLGLLLAGAAVWVFRDKVFRLAGVGNPASDKAMTRVADVTNDIAWKMDLTDAAFPEVPAAGKLRGEFVSCNHNTLAGGALGFRQSTYGLPELGVTVFFYADKPAELSGKTINIKTNDTPAPRVILRWKEGGELRSESYNRGYALKLQLGEIRGNHIEGKVYLSLPDEAQSRVAGRFTAEIKKSGSFRPH